MDHPFDTSAGTDPFNTSAGTDLSCPGDSQQSRTEDTINRSLRKGWYRVGVDIGGTFTDLVVFDDVSGRFAVGKTLTTPQDPSLAIETLLRETLEREGIDIGEVQQVIHGTTLVT